MKHFAIYHTIMKLLIIITLIAFVSCNATLNQNQDQKKTEPNVVTSPSDLEVNDPPAIKDNIIPPRLFEGGKLNEIPGKEFFDIGG